MLRTAEKFEDSVLATVVSDTDKYFVDAIAHYWLEQGGDSEGVFFLWHSLQQRIKEIENGDV